MWLVWGSQADGGLRLLGAGILLAAPRTLYGTNLLWTDIDCPGIREEAERLGYGGGPAASFLRLNRVVFPVGQETSRLENIGALRPGLNLATEDMANRLSQMLRV